MIRVFTSLSVVAGTLALTLFVLPSLNEPGVARSAAIGLACDWMLTIPILAYWFWVRRGMMPWITLLPLAVGGYVVAESTFPDVHQPVLAFAQWAVMPIELFLVGYLVYTARRLARSIPGVSGDFVTRFRTSARNVLGARIPADLLATEVAIFYHAFRPLRPAATNTNLFSAHREAGYPAVAAALLMVLAMETIGLHILVSQWSLWAAWILTGLSFYGLVWLIGDLRALLARPTEITATRLWLRIGIRYESEIALHWIRDVSRIAPADHASDQQPPTAAVLGEPNVALSFHRPVTLAGLYGFQKSSDRFWIRVDEPERFVQAIRQSCLQLQRSE